MGCRSSKKVREVFSLAGALPKNEDVSELLEVQNRAKQDDPDLQNVVELFVRCRDLIKTDKHSLTDPLAAFYTQKEDSDEWERRGITEVQKNNLNPEFTTSFKVSYCFEKTLICKLEVYDVDDFSNVHSLLRQTLIGSCLFTLHEIVSDPSKSMTKPILKKGKTNLGFAIISAEQTVDSPEFVVMKWELLNESPKGHLFLKFYRCGENKVQVHQTQAKSTRPVDWKPVEININRLCLGNDSLPIEVHLMQMNEKTGHKTIGMNSFTFVDIRNNPNFTLVLMNKDKPVATLALLEFRIEERFTFLDYIYGGCEVSFIIAIDFTQSNGPANRPDSLHYIQEGCNNQYMQAIKAIGEILQYYDSDGKIPVFGFGAKLPPTHSIVSHCFALNGNIFDLEVQGLSEVLEVYQKSVS